MAFKLTGVIGVDMTPETLTIALEGEDINFVIVPLTPAGERGCRDRAKVRADTDGLMVLGDMDKLQKEIAVEVLDSWTVQNEAGKVAKITKQTIGWLMDFSPEAAVAVRDVIHKSRAMYQERRRAVVGDGDNSEGN